MKFDKLKNTKAYLILLNLFILLTAGCSSLHTPQPENIPPASETPQAIILETRAPEIIKPESESVTGKPVETAPAAKTAWDALNNRKQFQPDLANPRIQKQIQRYLSEPDYISLVMQRAEPFLYHILQSLEKENMPAELVLLPVIESAYLSNARSRSGAGGLWQIMPTTARELGLKIDWGYDGRYDVLASTKAALNYLRLLNNRLENDWLLTLAAYNAGFTTVNQAIQKNRRKGKPTDYWHLALPEETMNYVPRFLAVIAMIDNPEAYSMTLPDVPWKSGFARIALKKPISLQQLARHSKVDLRRLQRLNPAYKRGVTPRKGKYELLARPEDSATLHDSIKQLPPAKLAKGQQHRIMSGETLSHISRHYGVSLAALRQANQLTSNRIRAGKTLTIPASLPSRYRNTVSNTAMHIIKQGDTLWGIAKRYSMTVQKLAHLNAMSIHETLQPGKALIIQDG